MPTVLAFLREHSNIPYHVHDIYEALHKEYNESTIDSGLARSNANPVIPIRRISQGMYMWDNNHKTPEIPVDIAPESPEVFERVGLTSNNKVVIRDEAGKLYILGEL